MATEIAQAYVQIMPSARGLKNSLTQAMGGEAAAAGQRAGGSIAGSIKNVLATAGIGAALGKAITEGSALEQSIGGIETLFKDAADVVKQRADEAYRTAGMSANQYMELTTSFSASLLKSLSGDTQKAADISDMAMTDMSDNANKMGTDMERITDAYQGFAKQNYTMLDNLKLGYGGTKSEMERLLDDAQKITGVKYDISNLSDVYSAIHEIQGKLDITGTTAKEAATTIGGSAKAMAGAFKNVLGKLTLGQDIGPALDALAETVTTFLVGNLLPAVWNILKALPGALITFVQAAAPQLAQGFMTFIPELQTVLTTEGPQILQTGFGILEKLLQGIVTGLPQLAEMALQLISMLAASLTENLPVIMTKGAELLTQFVVGISQSLPQLLGAAAEVILQMAVGLITNFPQILAAGFEMIGSMIRGIRDAFPNILNAALEVVGKVWDTITNTDWMELGKDIIRGLINGIGAMAGALWDAAKDIAKTALDAIKEFFGIASPSKVMRDQVGKWLPLGMAEGIRDNTEPVRRAMHSLAGTTMDSLPQRMAMRLSPAGVGIPIIAGGHQTILNQTIYTHDSLSESELTRQAEDMLARQKWGIP